MARYKVAPTKTNLFRMKREEAFAQEGHQLLEQKRDILMSELMAIVGKTTEAQKKLDDGIKDAYEALQKATVRMGRRRVIGFSLAVDPKTDITIRQRQVMGVRVPLVDVKNQKISPYYSANDTSIWLDETVVRFRRVLELLGQLAELRTTVLRFSQEVRKTIRRVNALEKIHLPDYQETIKYITDVLDEQGREAFFVLKLIKSRLEGGDHDDRT